MQRMGYQNPIRNMHIKQINTHYVKKQHYETVVL